MINRTSTYPEPETFMERRAADFVGIDERVRRNPGTSLLLVAGIGLAAGLIIRALRPEPTPQRRLVRLLEDLQDRLHDVSGPAIRRATSLASDGAQALGKNLQGREADLERLVRDASRKVSNFSLSKLFR